MFPFTKLEFLSLQQMADVAGYLSQVPMNPNNSVGPGTELAKGRRLYTAYCAECHGEDGEGVAEEYMPLVQGQHYPYLTWCANSHGSPTGSGVTPTRRWWTRSKTSVPEISPRSWITRLDYPPHLRGVAHPAGRTRTSTNVRYFFEKFPLFTCSMSAGHPLSPPSVVNCGFNLEES